MDSVIRGNPITLEAHYHLDGVLADPTLPRLTIRDPLGVAQVVDATPSRISAGIYQYTYPVALSALTGIWAAAWQGSFGVTPVTPATEYFEVLPVGAVSPVPSVTYTYNLGTDVGRVRLLIDDRDMSSVSTALPLEQRSAIFTDEEVGQFLTDKGTVYRAAAQALLTIAGNRSLLVQNRKVGRAELDYGGARNDLMKLAQTLIDMDNATPADGVAEIYRTDFGFRDVLTNAALRDNP